MAYVPDPNPARNWLKLELALTPPRTFGASKPFWPGSKDAPGKLPGRNVFTRLSTLKTLALGSMVMFSRIFMGHDALKSIDFSQGIPSALGATDPTVGRTQPRATMSLEVITSGPATSPGHMKRLPVGTWFATRHAPAGVKLLP